MRLDFLIHCYKRLWSYMYIHCHGKQSKDGHNKRGVHTYTYIQCNVCTSSSGLGITTCTDDPIMWWCFIWLKNGTQD